MLHVSLLQEPPSQRGKKRGLKVLYPCVWYSKNDRQIKVEIQKAKNGDTVYSVSTHGDHSSDVEPGEEIMIDRDPTEARQNARHFVVHEIALLVYLDRDVVVEPFGIEIRPNVISFGVFVQPLQMI